MIHLNKVFAYPCVSLGSVVPVATIPGVSDCKTHFLFVLLSAFAVKTTTVVQYARLYRVRAVKKKFQYIPGWIELNFQDISDAIYQANVAINILSLASIYLGAFGGAFGSNL